MVNPIRSAVPEATVEKEKARASRVAGEADAVSGHDFDAPMTPLSAKFQLTVFIVALCESTQINSLFAFAAFMVEDLVPGLAEEDVGYYAGVLAAAFQGAQCCTSIWWGRVSDRIGRKPAILIGLVGSIVALVVLGFAPTYAAAVLGRVLAGALNGNITVLKAYVAEVTDDTNRSKGFSLLPLSWGCGSVIGPLLGGLLSRPSKYWPGVPFFERWPYALPCLSMILIQVAAIVLTVFVLEETRPRRLTARVVHRFLVTLRLRRDAAPVHRQERTLATSAPAVVDEVAWQSLELGALPESPESNTPATGTPGSVRSLLPASPAADGGRLGHPADFDSGEDVDDSRGICGVLGDRIVLLACLNYGLLAFVYIVFDEALPLFFKAAKDRGGLGFSSSDIGIALGIGGFFSAVFVYLVAPRLVRVIGPLRSHRIGLWLTLAVLLVFPFVSLLSAIPSMLWPVICLLVATKLCVGCFTFVASMVLVNNSVAPADLGAANGLGQMLGSLARTVGPATGGAVFALSERQTFWMHQGTVAWMLAVLTLAGIAFARTLPVSLGRQLRTQAAPKPS